MLKQTSPEIARIKLMLEQPRYLLDADKQAVQALLDDWTECKAHPNSVAFANELEARKKAGEDDWQLAVDQCLEICDICDQVEVDPVSDAVIDFAASVHEKVSSICDTIERTKEVTKAQQTALDNMLAGIQKWNRE